MLEIVIKNKIKGIDLGDDITHDDLDMNPLHINPIDKIIGLFAECIVKAISLLEKNLNKEQKN